MHTEPPGKDSRSRYRSISASNLRALSAAAEGGDYVKPQCNQPTFVSPMRTSIYGGAPPVANFPTVLPENPGQSYMKLQAGLGNGSNHSRIHHQPITARPKPPQARTIHTGPKQGKIERTGAPLAESRTGSLHTVTPEDGQNFSTKTAVNDQRAARITNNVGPGGHDNAQSLAELPAQESEVQTRTWANPPPLIFELDATPIETHFVAELSADIEHAFSTSNNGRLESQSVPGAIAQSEKMREAQITLNNNTANAKPEEAAMSTHRCVSEQTTEPPTSQEHIATSQLPPSLMAGASHQQRRISANFSSPPVESLSSQPDILQTNASRYSQFFSPPASIPASSKASPELVSTPLSLYKAYNPTEVLSSPPTEAGRDRSSSFGAVKDVDGAKGYFKTHRRHASHDSHTSTASHDSKQLAQEYQAELPDFDQGYHQAK